VMLHSSPGFPVMPRMSPLFNRLCTSSKFCSEALQVSMCRCQSETEDKVPLFLAPLPCISHDLEFHTLSTKVIEDQPAT